MILDRVRQTVAKYNMISEGDCVVVGVSGGVDSVALLSVLSKLRAVYGMSLIVAHLNHRLRGAESQRDEAFVRDLARDLGLPCEVASMEVGLMKGRDMTLQEAAREARFMFFERVVQKHRAHRLALGQTADDQAETMVMRFIRGAGLGGLKGIPPVRNEVIHPLIETSRGEIETYLAREGLTYVEDSSNRKDIYLRNRIRRYVIPFLEGYNPNLKKSLVRMAQVLWQEDRYLERKVERFSRRMAWQRGNGVYLELGPFRRLDPALQFRVLKETLGAVSGMHRKRLGVVHVLSLLGLITAGNPHGLVDLPGGLMARRVYDRLEIRRKGGDTPRDFDVPLAIPGVTPIPEIGKRMISQWLDTWDLAESSSQCVFFDADRLHTSLRVRNRQHGDRFRPLGMPGSKKLKDCLIDWKVPMVQRKRVPLVVSGETIVWVVGYRISHEVRVTPETRRVMRLEIRDRCQGD
jgi:tRNA(Ile)-lysidine synthase